MKRLSKFEVESLVNTVVSKLDAIEREKLEKKCVGFIDEWNKELLELMNEKLIWEDKIEKKQEQIRKEIKGKGWDGVTICEWNNVVRIDKDDYIEYRVKNKIMDEIVINSLKDNNVEDLLDSLVRKFKS